MRDEIEMPTNDRPGASTLRGPLLMKQLQVSFSPTQSAGRDPSSSLLVSPTKLRPRGVSGMHEETLSQCQTLLGWDGMANMLADFGVASGSRRCG